MKQNDLIVVTTTVAAIADARKLADLLIQSRLAACVQIDGPIESHYQWDGKQEAAREHRLQIKSVGSVWSKLADFLAENHPYDEPEIIMQVIDDVSAGYDRWVQRQIGPR